MRPRAVTQEDVEFWSDPDGAQYEIGPMAGQHLGAEDIPSVLKGRDKNGTLIIKVAWEVEDRDRPTLMGEGETVWTTFWGGMPPSDVVIV